MECDKANRRSSKPRKRWKFFSLAQFGLIISHTVNAFRHGCSRFLLVLQIGASASASASLSLDTLMALQNSPLLLTAHDATGHVHLVIGANPLASARCSRSLSHGACPIVIAPSSAPMHYTLRQKIDEGSVKWLDKEFEDDDVRRLGREAVDGFVDAVFLTKSGASSFNNHVSALCRRLRIPVNVVDSQNLSSFTLLTTHSDGPLQIGITTSGKGCKLASRIRRETVSMLPANFGSAIEKLGSMRRRIWEEDHKAYDLAEADGDASDDDSSAQRATFNKLVLDSNHDAAKSRRIRWLSQICEYWPLARLAAITDEDIDAVLDSYKASLHNSSGDDKAPVHIRSRGQIILAGSGPGNPDLLTVATRNAIQSASIILADKLVPAAVLELVPRRTPVHIARKFPGNADAAQQELLDLGLEALKKGMIVLRLKQGDPYLYGRGGEEYSFFEGHGYKPIVLPGITSALSAPLFATIPATHRSVSDQVLICTGTGRKGVPPPPPTYNKSQTVVFLMALHRIGALIDSLTKHEDSPTEDKKSTGFVPWPSSTPCAVIERATCADQRVIRTTLAHVVTAIEEEGSRPPGLLVVGHACEVLRNPGGNKWIVEEGITSMPEPVFTPSAIAVA